MEEDWEGAAAWCRRRGMEAVSLETSVEADHFLHLVSAASSSASSSASPSSSSASSSSSTAFFLQPFEELLVEPSN